MTICQFEVAKILYFPSFYHDCAVFQGSNRPLSDEYRVHFQHILSLVWGALKCVKWTHFLRIRHIWTPPSCVRTRLARSCTHERICQFEDSQAGLTQVSSLHLTYVRHLHMHVQACMHTHIHMCSGTCVYMHTTYALARYISLLETTIQRSW